MYNHTGNVYYECSMCFRSDVWIKWQVYLMCTRNSVCNVPSIYTNMGRYGMYVVSGWTILERNGMRGVYGNVSRGDIRNVGVYINDEQNMHTMHKWVLLPSRRFFCTDTMYSWKLLSTWFFCADAMYGWKLLSVERDDITDAMYGWVLLSVERNDVADAMYGFVYWRNKPVDRVYIDNGSCVHDTSNLYGIFSRYY